MSAVPGERIDLKDKAYGLVLESERGRYRSYLVTEGFHLYMVQKVFRLVVDGDNPEMTIELNEVQLPGDKCIYIDPKLTAREVQIADVIGD